MLTLKIQSKINLRLISIDLFQLRGVCMYSIYELSFSLHLHSLPDTHYFWIGRDGWITCAAKSEHVCCSITRKNVSSNQIRVRESKGW